jgi:hypothetical protein
MKKLLFFLFVSAGSWGQQLTLEQANHLASLPLKCLQQEFPNKPGEVLVSKDEVMSPQAMHPAFYGCFDWHSSVHGHWSLVYLINTFPKIEYRADIIKKLKTNLSAVNIQKEVAYFSKAHEKSFERTYGWVWLLKLQHELDRSEGPELKLLATNLQPLTDLLISRYIEFLPKLLYPVRVGTHSNTAFGLSFAWDYAVHSNNTALQKSIRENALRLFKDDKGCPFNWEPSGTDFLSPCMEEIGLMRRLLTSAEFLTWVRVFAPELCQPGFQWEVARVSDRTDGHLVHLDGLNFSRAWNMLGIAKVYPKEFKHLRSLAEKHLASALPSVVDGNYEGEHWLASFALHAFEVME